MSGMGGLIMCVLVCGALSFLFSGMEAGVFSLNRFRLRHMARRGHAQAAALVRYLDQPESFLWTVLCGNTLANFVVFGIGATVAYKHLIRHPAAAVTAYAGFVFLFYTISDLLPKMLFRAQPERFCFAMVRPFIVVQRMLHPLVWIVEWVSRIISRLLSSHIKRMLTARTELRLMMEDSLRDMPGEEQALIRRVLALENTQIRHIARPLAEVVAVQVDTPLEQVLGLAQDHGLARLPVWGIQDGRKRVIGMIDVDALIFGEGANGKSSAGECLSPIPQLDEDLPADVALARLRMAGQRMAVVVQRDGTPVGLISMSDILETIFGKTDF